MANYNTIAPTVKSPCYRNGTDCPNRVVGCHGRCEAYQRFWEQRREANKRRLEYLEMNNAFWELSAKRVDYKAHFKRKHR